MDKDKKPAGPFGAPMETPVRSSDLQELYRRLQPSARRGKPSPEVAAALEAAQKLSTEIDAEEAANDTTQKLTVDGAIIVCASCGYHNREGNKFCGMCGAVAVVETGRPAAQAIVPPSRSLWRESGCPDTLQAMKPTIITTTIITTIFPEALKAEDFRARTNQRARTRCVPTPLFAAI